jgi:hypothetical protein
VVVHSIWGVAEAANKVGYFTVKVVNFIVKVTDFNPQLIHRPVAVIN